MSTHLAPHRTVPYDHDVASRTEFVCRRGMRWMPIFLLAAFLSAAPAPHRAAPELVIIHAGILTSPVFITDKRETSAFGMTESASIAEQDLATRPHFDVALFWGTRWAAYARDSVRAGALEPEQADQQGRIYLARRLAEAPVFVFLKGAPDARTVRRVSPHGIHVLQQYDIPTVMAAR